MLAGLAVASGPRLGAWLILPAKGIQPEVSQRDNNGGP